MLPQKILHEIAITYLDNIGIKNVEDLLLHGNYDYAKAYLAGGLDALWENSLITNEEAEILYKRLGLSADFLSTLTFEKIH